MTDTLTNATGNLPQELTLENLEKAIKTLKKPRFVFSQFMEHAKIIGMKEAGRDENFPRPAFKNEEPDFYICTEQTYNELMKEPQE